MNTADTVLANARICLPGGSIVEGWVATHNSRIEAIGEGAAPAARETVDCKGCLILPGIIEIPVHFRDPGFTYKEDFLTASTAAAFGGVTTVVDMPNTEGQVVTPDDLRRKIAYLRGRSYVDFGLYALLKDSAGHVEGLKDLGVAGLKWLLGYKYEQGTTEHLVIPPSNADIRATLAKGRTDAVALIESRPPFVEAIGVAEACLAAAEFGCRLHIHHLSSGKGLQTALAMKERLGANVSIETCPHYLFLTDEDVARLGPRANVNPPIKYRGDVDALWAGIHRREIDCIATDHAPHSPEEKLTGNVWDARSGLLGVETTFPLVFHEVIVGQLPLGRFMELTSEAPARIIGYSSRKGSLLPGHDADLIVVDPNGQTVITAGTLHSKHPLTVYEGMERRGRIVGVYLRGRPVVRDGRLIGQPVGSYLPVEYRRAAPAGVAQSGVAQ